MVVDRIFCGEVRVLLQDVVKEMGFVVDSICQEVVEKGWFGECVMLEVVQVWGYDDVWNGLIEGLQDFSQEWDSVYGCDLEGLECEWD